MVTALFIAGKVALWAALIVAGLYLVIILLVVGFCIIQKLRGEEPFPTGKEW